ncbi:LacI family DNA-binding transcriptional regulator [Pseudactinotalea terrae]|uniref:LacI family DNA-binding transcriptional regulator n=1 Tax=Pseudactinotalea terrae TaxID=1743262 RepID=UPI001F4FFD04|nr:LacI family DNA-binding transcriptional regulator [Pseudactinotalea terrae]
MSSEANGTNGRRPGMTDVARLAGVSHQTVSRVLNDHASVRPATRERVLAAIEQLGYRRNLSARALVTRRSGLIGIVASGSSRSGPAGTLGALEQAARAASYFVTVAIAPEPEPGLHSEIAAAFVEQGVEGVVVIAPTAEVAEIAQDLNAQVPVLVVSAWDPPDDVPTISVDQRGGAQLAAEHLLGLGHTDVVHVSGPTDWYDAAARIEGWHTTLAAAGVTPRPDLVGDWSSERGYELGRSLLDDLPTAVFAANDLTALGVLRAFAEAGVRVPDDVSVIGFDDLEGSANFYPPLTTVKQDLRALGAAALGALVEVIAGGDALPRRLPPTLVPRASTAAPRTS